jgi:hypothetical protein
MFLISFWRLCWISCYLRFAIEDHHDDQKEIHSDIPENIGNYRNFLYVHQLRLNPLDHR